MHIRLKEHRLEEISSESNFTFIKGSIADKELINKLFDEIQPEHVAVNLAAQAGVRYSITNPRCIY